MIYAASIGYTYMAMVLIAIDRLTKIYALGNCVSECVINAYLSFELSINRGISWGILHSPHPIIFTFVSSAIAVMTLFLAWYAYRHYAKGRPIIGYTCIVAGSCANLIDRVLYGGVVDFIIVSYGNYSWPVFNIADMAIVIGVFLVLAIDER